MTMASRSRRRVFGVIGATLAALFVMSVAAAPAHATLGPAQSVDIQLRSYSDSGGEYLVGRVVGTIQFDSGNTQYRLAVTICRQSSYTSPNMRIYVNGTPGPVYAGEDGVRRPHICGGHGLSNVVDGLFTYGGTIVGISVTIEGIHFDGSTARTVSKGRYYDNPFN
ncbi:hypothetical protein [Allorhizocola rhizosphaerae]|uniref:hypothetical protein n=1 Tax=Allorhizocola rhizosphaerae TaxID=1872709 RepID=UPI000E3EB5A2|nr:hypothetical protein [Allorhizocola rhizosphaerae]